ncbi:AI-2E family transporter [Baekduia soli]|uniref:AI-2E family transporter n=1 Tax=Baekduia soli TaxID=496014 RepID=UPI0016524570|nr:AI-2E family transporter [Baekduia soli]
MPDLPPAAPDATPSTIDGAPEEPTQATIEDLHADAAQEAGATDDREYGRLGERFDRRAPFYVGFMAALGVACAAALAWTVVAAGQVLILIGLAFFIALGLEPAVLWLYRRGLPRWAAVLVVLALCLGAFAGFLVLAVPVVVTQASHLADELPAYLHTAKDRSTEVGRLNAKYHFVASVQRLLNGKSSFNTALTVGKAVLDLVASVVVVVVVTVYLLADLPRVRHGVYRLAPRSRRARMVLLTDEVFGRVGGYVLGNATTSVIAGAATWVWGLAFGIPYALLLGLLVAILDLVPMIGSTVGGIIVSLIALTISVKLAVATAAFYTMFRLLEDYLLMPRVMAHTVAVPGLITVVATALGGALLGIVGALVAIPVAAAVKLMLDEVMTPRLDDS